MDNNCKTGVKVGSLVSAVGVLVLADWLFRPFVQHSIGYVLLHNHTVVVVESPIIHPLSTTGMPIIGVSHPLVNTFSMRKRPFLQRCEEDACISALFTFVKSHECYSRNVTAVCGTPARTMWYHRYEICDIC